MSKHLRTDEMEYIEARAALTNDPLSDTEESVVRELLSETEDDITSLEATILRLQTVISTLQRRREEGLSRIERLRTGIAPHRKVPTKILTKIFAYVLGEQALPLPPRSGEPIWNILWVCSWWRCVAIADPVLWNHIQGAGLKEREALSPLLYDIFANRGHEGLITYRAPWVTNARAWDNLSSLLSAYPSRLRHIDIMFRNFLPPRIKAPPIKLDCMESVNISFEWRDNYDGKIAPATDFFTSETLRKVEISSYKTSPSQWFNRVCLPWSQLTDLTIRSIPVSAMETILEQCVCLLRCAVQLGGKLIQQNVSSYPILLEHLQSLLFCYDSDFASTEYLLDLLTVPALTYLSFENQNWKKWPQESVLDLVSRSTCSLEVLMTPERSVEEWEIVPMMQAMPGLTELHLSTKTHIADSTIDTIRREGLAPELRILHNLRLSSLRPFIELLESLCEDEGGGERRGICVASVVLREDHSDIDEGYYEEVSTRLEKCGVDLEVFTM